MNNERTVMTNEYLAKCDMILEDIQTVCREVCNLGYSWNKACERHGINPVKARSVLLSTLPNCTKLEPIDETFLEDAYDGGWYIYRAVFGYYNLENHSLPYDYEASVDHVLKTLDNELEDVVRRHFGLNPYKEMQCYKEIAGAHGITENKARRMLQDALRILRRKKTSEVLVHGLSKYQIMQDNAKREHDAELIRMKEEYDIAMEKRRKEHEQLMEKLEDSTFSEAVGTLTGEENVKELKEMSIDVLDLSVRSYNALYRNNIQNMYDVVMTEPGELSRMRGMGQKSMEEVKEACVRWAGDNFYGMSPSEVRDMIKKKEVSV